MTDFADRLIAEGCPRIGWRTARNLRFADVETEEDWLKGDWRYKSRGIGPALEEVINKHIGKQAIVPHRLEIRRPEESWTYVTSLPADESGTRIPAYHYTAYRMTWRRPSEEAYVAALCGQTPRRGQQYSLTPPEGHPFCKLCSWSIDKEIAKH